METLGQIVQRNGAAKPSPQPPSVTRAKPRASEPCPAYEEIDRLQKLIVWRPSSRAEPVGLLRLLTEDERRRLSARAAGLEEALRPFSEEEAPRVKSALAAMFSGFRQMRQADEDMEATLTVARAVLREFPAWAIERACLNIARREIKEIDARYPPSDAQIVDVVRNILKQRQRALTDAVIVLGGEVPSYRKRA